MDIKYIEKDYQFLYRTSALIFNDTKTKISSCKEAKNMTLKEYLKDLNINVDNYSTICKRLTSNSLSLEISVINSDNKNIYYKIPIKLNENC